MELKIKLKVKDTEIELTEDEARELKKRLDNICAWKTEYVPYYPTYPTWTWPLEWWQQPYTNTCAPDDTITIYNSDGAWECDPSIWAAEKPSTTKWNISPDVQVSYSYS